MELLNHYFGRKDIIKLIAKYRINVASKRHNIHIFNDIRSKRNHECPLISTHDKIDEIILDIIPSRRTWIKFNEKKRKKYKNSTAESVGSVLATIDVYRQNLKKNKDTEPQQWFVNLNNFIEKVRTTVLKIDSYSLKSPDIIPEKKDKNKPDNAYRPIAHFKVLLDKILIGQTAKYLTDLLDPEFCDSASYAFRSKLNKTEAITHHDAIERISKYREKNSKNDLWVAECDIKKFYDCINHTYVKRALDVILTRLKAKNIKIDHRALTIFNLYLNSYSFVDDVLSLNDDLMERVGGEFKWERENLTKEFYPKGICERIGVPQGGALSCLIANIILDNVDRAVLQVEEQADRELLYLRYCDDMIIIHPDRKKCEEALLRYQNALKVCKLLCHEPKPVEIYDSSFWDEKSKSPYKWAKKQHGANTVPWLAFVGYQIRYDGVIRIRKKSLEKELKKQKQVVDNTLKAICYKDSKNRNENVRRTSHQILHRVNQKLIFMSVGKVKLWHKTKNPQLSWTAGFKHIDNNIVSSKQMKALDRGRTLQVKKLKSKLKNIVKESAGHKPDMENIYHGSPFSYHNFIVKPPPL